MPDWKEINIVNYLSMGNGKKTIEERMAKDPAISKLSMEIEEANQALAILESGYNEKILFYEIQMEELKDQIKVGWDIEDKTFKCPAGNVTIKTTKSLIVANKSGLIQRLTAIFEDATKACDCIRTFDLSAIRKYMDADLIDEKIAYYNKKQSVVITEARDK